MPLEVLPSPSSVFQKDQLKEKSRAEKLCRNLLLPSPAAQAKLLESLFTFLNGDELIKEIHKGKRAAGLGERGGKAGCAEASGEVGRFPLGAVSVPAG